MSDDYVRECDPLYGQVDAILEQLTKSKSLHILMVLDRKNKPFRFSEIKERVRASSTTVSRRLAELIDFDLVERRKVNDDSNTYEYEISEYGKQLSPIMQSFYELVKQRGAN
ncbi:MAG: winged helix-turn-helix transcriptional regulator [Candidatus Poseidoniaceae archaeon]